MARGTLLGMVALEDERIPWHEAAPHLSQHSLSLPPFALLPASCEGGE